MFTWTWPALLELITQVWLCAPPQHQHPPAFLPKWKRSEARRVSPHFINVLRRDTHLPNNSEKDDRMCSGRSASPVSFKWKFALGDRRRCICSWIIRLAKSAQWKKEATLASHERLARQRRHKCRAPPAIHKKRRPIGPRRRVFPENAPLELLFTRLPASCSPRFNFLSWARRKIWGAISPLVLPLFSTNNKLDSSRLGFVAAMAIFGFATNDFHPACAIPLMPPSLQHSLLVTESAHSLCLSIPAHMYSNHHDRGTIYFLMHFVCLVSRPVNSRLCAPEEPPSAVQRCSIPCQHRCLLSQWSPWGACLHDSCNEPQGRRGTTWRTCGKRGGTNFLFNLLPEMSSRKKKERAQHAVRSAGGGQTCGRQLEWKAFSFGCGVGFCVCVCFRGGLGMGEGEGAGHLKCKMHTSVQVAQC